MQYCGATCCQKDEMDNTDKNDTIILKNRTSTDGTSHPFISTKRSAFLPRLENDVPVPVLRHRHK